MRNDYGRALIVPGAVGVVAWSWFMLYGITRSIAEIWREPGFTVIGLSGGQLVALPMVFIGGALLYVAIRQNRHTDETPVSPATVAPQP